MVSSNSYKKRSQYLGNINSGDSSKSLTFSEFGPSINTSCLTEVSISTSERGQDEVPVVSYDKTKKIFILNFRKQKLLADEILKYTKDTKNKSFVILQLGNNENIKVTSLLLSHASSLIERIISKKKDNVCCISAKLFNPYHMKNIINFLKTGKIIFKIEDLVQLFAIINRFEMSSISTLFETSLLSCVNSNKSLLTTLLNYVSDTQNLPSTKMKTNLLEIVNYYFNNIIIGQHFFDLSPSALIFILSSDTLEISNENDIMRIGVIFMDKVDCFGYADSIFNCIRFNHCNKEMLHSMRKELINYGNKHLLYVFDCFCPDLNPSLVKDKKQSTKSVSRKNVNCLIKRDNKSYKSSIITNSLKQFMNKLISENTKVKSNVEKGDHINSVKDVLKSSSKTPKKFNVMPSTPSLLKKLRKSNTKKEIKTPMNTQQNSSVDSIESNPYRNLTKYKNRLFSADSIYNINKYQNAFEYNFNGDLYKTPVPHYEKEQLPKINIEKNPYYYAFKDKERRKFSPESVFEIGCLSPKFTKENNKSEVSNSKENMKKNYSLDNTQCSSKSTNKNEPLSFNGKTFKVNLPIHNESKN